MQIAAAGQPSLSQNRTVPVTDQPPSAERSKLAALAHQFSRFLAVGVATTVVHYGVLIALVEAWAVGPVWATTAGFLTAVLFSYLLNRRFTFDERPSFHSGLLKYYAAVSVGLFLNAGTMALLTAWGLWYLLAQIIASGVALIWNFLAARFVVFRSRSGERSQSNFLSGGSSHVSS
jgi:putative flippase GtrA